MLKHIEHITNVKKRLTIEIPAEVIEGEIHKRLVDAQKQARLPGFRPGKVPLTIIDKRFGKTVESEVLEKIVPDYYTLSLQESGLSPVSMPNMEESIQFKRNNPISFTVTVEVEPEVELNYEDIYVDEFPVNITDEDVNQTLNSTAMEKSNYEVSEDAIEEGDLVDFDCACGGDVKKDIVIKAGSIAPYPADFAASFISRKAEDTYQIEVDFSEKPSLPLNGMKGTMDVKIGSVKKRIKPLLDDDFAKDIGFETLEELKKVMKEEMISNATMKAQYKKIGQILEILAERHEFELPESMLQHELNNMLNQAKASEKNSKGDEELKAELLPAARKNVKVELLIKLIGKKEGIKVSQQEMEGELYRMAKQHNVQPEEVLNYYMKTDGSLLRIHNHAYTNKVLALLLEKAKVKGGEIASQVEEKENVEEGA